MEHRTPSFNYLTLVLATKHLRELAVSAIAFWSKWPAVLFNPLPDAAL